MEKTEEKNYNSYYRLDVTTERMNERKTNEHECGRKSMNKNGEKHGYAIRYNNMQAGSLLRSNHQFYFSIRMQHDLLNLFKCLSGQRNSIPFQHLVTCKVSKHLHETSNSRRTLKEQTVIIINRMQWRSQGRFWVKPPLGCRKIFFNAFPYIF